MKTIMQAALLNGMNTHNARERDSKFSARIKLIDFCKNVYTLFVWVDADTRLFYLLDCNGTPNSVSNIFRAELPSDPTIFDDTDDMLAAIAATANVAESVTIL